MPLNKNQIARMIKFTGMMKRGQYPNAKSFVRMLEKAEANWDELGDLLCSEKTIRRDIKMLKEVYGAPIEFDHAKNGYYLTRNYWELNVPVLQDEAMLGSLIGCKLAEEFMPEPIRSEIENAVDEELTTNAPEILDTGYIDSLIVASGVNVRIQPKVGKLMFDAWQRHEAVFIFYEDRTGKLSRRSIEPHALVYCDSAWYVKAICREKKVERVFALHRILDIELLGKFFEPDIELIRRTKESGLFDFSERMAHDIDVLCDAEIAPHVRERERFNNATKTENGDGTVTLHIPQAPSFEVDQWALSKAGHAKILSPAHLVEQVAEAAEKILEAHR